VALSFIGERSVVSPGTPVARYELTTSVVIGTDCIGSCKSNYHTITTTTIHVERKVRNSISWDIEKEDSLEINQNDASFCSVFFGI
jgi:hypothetical protein